MRDDWSSNLFACKGIPVHAGKPPVCHDIFCSTSEVPQTFGPIGREKTSNQILGEWVDVTWESDSVGNDLKITTVLATRPCNPCTTYLFIDPEWMVIEEWLQRSDGIRALRSSGCLRKRTGYPHSISKHRIPKAHQSTAFPWPFDSTISGARY